jgi:serine/threonine protein kinase
MGVVLYEMLTGTLPFAASNPMERLHAHIARQLVPLHERSKDIPGPASGIVIP